MTDTSAPDPESVHIQTTEHQLLKRKGNDGCHSARPVGPTPLGSRLVPHPRVTDPVKVSFLIPLADLGGLLVLGVGEHRAESWLAV